MKFIFSTGSLYTYSPDRIFAFAVEAGFDGIELMADHRWDTRQADYVEELIQRHSLPVLALHSPFSPVPGWSKEQPEIIAQSVKLAEAIGAPVIIHHLPKRFNWMTLQMAFGKQTRVPLPFGNPERGYASWLENGYQQLQERTDVLLCIENMPAHPALGWNWRFYDWNAYDMDHLHDICRFPYLTMDTTHLATWGLEAVDVYKQWRQKVQHVHLSNYDGREHRRPEAGTIHLDALLAEMANDGYERSISMELHPDALEEGAPDERIVELMSTSLGYCRRWANQG
ncbi:MAG: sugar phosphate isomerase/epimerase [Chloroflexota bacterium]